MEVATLTGGAADNSFTVSGWSGTGTLDGAGGTDSVVATNDVDFTLTNTSLARTTLGALTLASIESATLTGGAANNSFTVSGWSGTGTLDGAGGTGDSIVATNDVDFTLANTSLARSGGQATLTLREHRGGDADGRGGGQQLHGEWVERHGHAGRRRRHGRLDRGSE